MIDGDFLAAVGEVCVWVAVADVIGLLMLVFSYIENGFPARRVHASPVIAAGLAIGWDPPPRPARYNRRAWLRDMENPGLSIDQIADRVRESGGKNGTWRRS